MDKVVQDLKCFTKNKKKVHLLCGCEDDVIHAISLLLFNFLGGKLEVKKKAQVRKKLYPIRYFIRLLADKRVSLRRKRKILVDPGIRLILFPIIKSILVPTLLKSMKEK